MKRIGTLFLFVMAAGLSFAAGGSGREVGWRTDGTGLYPGTDPVYEWSAASNVIWKTALPNWGNTIPILVKDRLFLCVEPATLLCVDARDGTILWQQTNTCESMATPEEAAQFDKVRKDAEALRKQLRQKEQEAGKLRAELKKNPAQTNLKAKVDALQPGIKDLKSQCEVLNKTWYLRPVTHDVNGYSSPTPTSDGENVYVVFGSGIVASYDLDGHRRWIKFIEKPVNEWGHSASPLLVGGKLLVHILNVTALNPASGETLWQTRVKERWGSPVATRIGAVDVAVTAGGDILRASDGKLLARQLSPLEYCAPLVHSNRLYFIENGGKAFSLPDAGAESDSLSLSPLWQTKPAKERYYASPVYHDGLIYAVMQHGTLSVIDAETGSVVAENKMDFKGTFFPSLCLAGNALFVSSDKGITAVFKPGRKLELISRNSLEPFRSTPIFDGRRIYIQGLKNLYCVGRP